MPRSLLTVLVFVLPMTAAADVSETTILPADTALNLDTGAVASSGGDLLWSGGNIIPQDKAKAVLIGAFGVTAFKFLTRSNVALFVPDAKSSPIPGSKLQPGDGLVVVTNSGKTAKVLVWENAGGAITLQFTTFGAPALADSPLISEVLNNSSGIGRGYPNYGIAPSSLFVVKGSGLADPGVPVLQSSAAPGLSTTLNGASITVVVGGVTTHPAFYYTSPTQLAAVMPTATPVGTGTLTVTYRGVTSPPSPIQIVPVALGINTYNFGTGVATDGITGALLTLTNSGAPGETIVLWTTGLGANPADSDTTATSSPHRVDTPMLIYIGGVLATIRYQGASVYPGVNQINVIIPPSVPTGCFVSLVAVTGSILSNTVTLPINDGGGVCLDAETGLRGDQIAPAATKTLRTGLVSLVQTNRPGKGDTRIVSNSANAAFEKYTGIYSPGTSISPGSCLIDILTPVPVGVITGLDTGAITLDGPSGLAVTLRPQGLKGAFFANLAAGAIPSSGGTFTFKGAGGADVGSFTSTVNLSNPLLTWTNSSAAVTVDRTQDLTITWTGGNPGTYVVIGGAVTSTAGLTMGYTCRAAVDAGQFTVPSYLLSGLPAGKGGTSIQNDLYLPLSATGLDVSLALGDISYNIASAYK